MDLFGALGCLTVRGPRCTRPTLSVGAPCPASFDRKLPCQALAVSFDREPSLRGPPERVYPIGPIGHPVCAAIRRAADQADDTRIAQARISLHQTSQQSPAPHTHPSSVRAGRGVHFDPTQPSQELHNAILDGASMATRDPLLQRSHAISVRPPSSSCHRLANPCHRATAGSPPCRHCDTERGHGTAFCQGSRRQSATGTNKGSISRLPAVL